MGDRGFLALEVPETYGGPGRDDWRYTAVLLEEAQHSGFGDALQGPLLHSSICSPYLISAATPDQRERWFRDVATGARILAIALTEPASGSDLAAIKTRAHQDGDDYVLDGVKTLITNGVNADLVIVAARTGDDPVRGVSLLVVERGMP